MLVKMNTPASSPDGHLRAGRVYNLPKAKAEDYCRTRANGRAYAQAVKSAGKGGVSEPERDMSPSVSPPVDAE